jgi:hypothetical protein
VFQNVDIHLREKANVEVMTNWLRHTPASVHSAMNLFFLTIFVLTVGSTREEKLCHRKRKNRDRKK